MLLVSPLTLSPISACLLWHRHPRWGYSGAPGCPALLGSPFGFSSPGEASGSKPRRCQGPGSTEGQGPWGPREVLQQLPQPLTLGLLLPLLNTCVNRARADSKKLLPPCSCSTPPRFRVSTSCSLFGGQRCRVRKGGGHPYVYIQLLNHQGSNHTHPGPTTSGRLPCFLPDWDRDIVGREGKWGLVR